MMWKIRTTKTGSGNIAVQVVENSSHTVNIIKHIGSAKNEEELEDLKKLGSEYIEKHNLDSGFIPLFNDKKSSLISIDNLSVKESHHTFAYEFLSHIYNINGFDNINDSILRDLAIMRILEPVSKEESIRLLKEYFNVKYSHGDLHRGLKRILEKKDKIENVAVEYAKKTLNFDFSLVFYDVTNLYFESFKSDDFRQPGFNKDGKSMQPQVAIGLVVNQDGYPIAIDMFEGKKYEGHTFLLVILGLKEKYNIKTLTVVADAGMLSYKNMEELNNEGISFIVGARLFQVDRDLLKEIVNKLNMKEGKYIESDTKYGALICDYSRKRASKDKSDREKQIKKANYHIENPTKHKRPRFVLKPDKQNFELNNELIEFDKLKEGIKGYYTNLNNISPQLIISRYHDLWHVEKAFRITKGDLQARPIFHRKEDMIKTHILIVFVALCISKLLELKTGLSIKVIKKNIFPIVDVVLIDKLTKREFIKRQEFPDSDVFSKIKELYT